jgi:hypothetical protein
MENIITGKMQAIITKVSSHEIVNTKTRATRMKRTERTNIDTFEERPS